MTGTLDDPVQREARAALVDAPHVAALNAYARSLMRDGRAVPWFDPLDGGIGAHLLVLLETPARGGLAPRFVSRDNPAPAQRNLAAFLAEAGLPRERTVLWNAVPWIGDAQHRHRALPRRRIEDGLHALAGLLPLLPALRAIVLAGRVAQSATRMLESAVPRCRLLPIPHPSPLSVCTHPSVRVRIAVALAAARGVLDDTGASAAVPARDPDRRR